MAYDHANDDFGLRDPKKGDVSLVAYKDSNGQNKIATSSAPLPVGASFSGDLPDTAADDLAAINAGIASLLALLASPTAGVASSTLVTSSGSAQPLLGSSTPCKLVKLCNASTNSGPMVWGFDNSISVSGLVGVEIPVGGVSAWIPIDDAAKIYVLTTGDNEIVGYAYV